MAPRCLDNSATIAVSIHGDAFTALIIAGQNSSSFIVPPNHSVVVTLAAAIAARTEGCDVGREIHEMNAPSAARGRSLTSNPLPTLVFQRPTFLFDE